MAKTRHVWIQMLFIIGFFTFLTYFSSVQPSFAAEIEIPKNATDVTESDFPLQSTDGFYRFSPEKNVLINSRSTVYQVKDSKCVSVEEAINIMSRHAIVDYYYLEENNTYYLSRSFHPIDLYDSVTLTFDGNGGSIFGMEKYDVHVPVGLSFSPTADQLTDSADLDGYYVNGWNTNPDGSGLSITQYDHFSKELTFYAIWCRKTPVTLDANGGFFLSEKIDPDTNDYMKKSIIDVRAIEQTPGEGSNLRVITFENIEDYGYNVWNPSRDGYQFKGWNSSPDGNGIDYGNGSTITDAYGIQRPVFINEKTYLYAIWICAEGNHVFNEWKTIKEPTCSRAGTRESECSVCHTVKTESIPVLGHTWNTEYTVDTAATYDADGSKSIHCSVCNAVKVGSETPIPKMSVKATTLSKVSPASKGFKVMWKKGSDINGYEIQYALNSKFTKGKKTVKIAKSTIASKKITKLNAKKKYYVRIRTYKKISGKKYYSAWSKAKQVTTKK